MDKYEYEYSDYEYKLEYSEIELEEKEKEKAKQEALKREYDSMYDGEEQMQQQLISISSNINRYIKEIQIEDIITTEYKKVSRADSIIGLNGIVSEWGVVNPIHVLALEDDDMYMLLEGLRRVFALARNGVKEVTAIVWDFEDKEEGKEKANLLSAMINRSQKYTAKEQWEQMKILEEVNQVTPGLIEYLLQMDAGDSMKLKDVMLADSDFIEIKQKLLEGELTIDGAYKKLCSERKKQNKLAKEDNVVIEGGSGVGADGIIDEDSVSSDPKLSVDEVKDLLELRDVEIGEDETFDSLNKTDEIRGNVVQDTKDRKPIDQAVKQNTLIRDDFKCRCCGLDGKEGWLGIMVYHHLIPVYCGGPDTVDNGLTLCSNCHITLHNYLFGKVQVKLEELTEEQQTVFKNIFKYGNIALEAQKRAGLSRKEADKLDAGGRKHMMPGTGLEDNKKALAVANAQKKSEE